MLYSVLGFNQEQAVKSKLTLNDILILKYIIMANGTDGMRCMTDEEDKSYVWLSHTKILEDLPILGITEATLRNKLNTLKANGWIVSMNISNGRGKGSRTYYAVTKQCTELQYSPININVNEDSADEKFGCPSKVTRTRCPSKVTPYNLLSDNRVDTDISKDISVGEPTKDISFSNPKDEDDTDNNKKDNGTVKRELKERKIKNLINVEACHNVTEEKPKKKSKKKSEFKNKFDEMAYIINNFTDNEDLRTALFEYGKMRLDEERKNGREFIMNIFSASLRKLKAIDGVDEQIKSVYQSKDEKWGGFFPYKDKNQEQSMRNRGIQMQKSDAKAFKDGAEAKEYTENLQKEYMKSGRRAVF